MFKNPPQGTAGGLIEAAGLKGRRLGAAEVSNKHGNFFLAHPGATAQDVYDLMALVQSVVLERSGVTLLPEVKLIGEFDLSADLKMWAEGDQVS
jgi:UDP-N-acetylmuramate dehydrogenase